VIVSIASGKGGTGKTTIATNLALSLTEIVQFLDCDVEEPNADIFLEPIIQEEKQALVFVPQIAQEKCIHCGKCAKVCAFNAIAVIPKQTFVYPELCHHCGSCSYFCPTRAISEVEKETGELAFGYKDSIEFIQGRLNIGEVMPIPVIKEVKKYLEESKTVIIDSPPGTSCSMIESVTGSDFCVLVTEPTPFGLNDLILAVEVLQKIEISFGVIINRSDLGNQDVENFCKNNHIPILMQLPFDEKIAVAYSNGIPLVKLFPDYKTRFADLFEQIKRIIT